MDKQTIPCLSITRQLNKHGKIINVPAYRVHIAEPNENQIELGDELKHSYKLISDILEYIRLVQSINVHTPVIEVIQMGKQVNMNVSFIKDYIAKPPDKQLTLNFEDNGTTNNDRREVGTTDGTNG